MTSLCLLLFAVLLLVSLYGVGVRLNRARGVERQQLKWFAYGAAALTVTFIGLLPLLWSGLFVAILIGFGLVTACVTVAMLRYHLYDIDRLINRSLVYGLLTVTLSLAYALVVFALRQMWGIPRTWHSSLVVAGSTLAVAAPFQPARRRIQAKVDQRFDRRRYDAARTIEAFAVRLREEIDLDTLTTELLAVVDHTMKPTKASLWLRATSPPDNGRNWLSPAARVYTAADVRLTLSGTLLTSPNAAGPRVGLTSSWPCRISVEAAADANLERLVQPARVEFIDGRLVGYRFTHTW